MLHKYQGTLGISQTLFYQMSSPSPGPSSLPQCNVWISGKAYYDPYMLSTVGSFFKGLSGFSSACVACILFTIITAIIAAVKGIENHGTIIMGVITLLMIVFVIYSYYNMTSIGKDLDPNCIDSKKDEKKES